MFSLSTDPLFNLEFVEIALQILTAEDMTEPKYKGWDWGHFRALHSLALSKKNNSKKTVFGQTEMCNIITFSGHSYP